MVKPNYSLRLYHSFAALFSVLLAFQSLSASAADLGDKELDPFAEETLGEGWSCFLIHTPGLFRAGAVVELVRGEYYPGEALWPADQIEVRDRFLVGHYKASKKMEVGLFAKVLRTFGLSANAELDKRADVLVDLGTELALEYISGTADDVRAIVGTPQTGRNLRKHVPRAQSTRSWLITKALRARKVHYIVQEGLIGELGASGGGKLANAEVKYQQNNKGRYELFWEANAEVGFVRPCVQSFEIYTNHGAAGPRFELSEEPVAIPRL